MFKSTLVVLVPIDYLMDTTVAAKMGGYGDLLGNEEIFPVQLWTKICTHH
jgi:hypothetical protein